MFIGCVSPSNGFPIADMMQLHEVSASSSLCTEHDRIRPVEDCDGNSYLINDKNTSFFQLGL